MKNHHLLTFTFLAVLFLIASTLKPGQDDFAASKARGKDLYEVNCIACHLPDGKGIEGVFPPLAKSDYFRKGNTEIARVILKGARHKMRVNGVDYENEMPSHALSNQEVADLINYIRNAWGNQAKPVQLGEVAKAR